MPQREPHRIIAALRALLDELDADLAAPSARGSSADSADADDHEDRYIAERAATQLSRYRAKTVPRPNAGRASSRGRKAS